MKERTNMKSIRQLLSCCLIAGMILALQCIAPVVSRAMSVRTISVESQTELLSILGIYQESNPSEEEVISRADFATVIARLSFYVPLSTQKQYYTDVPNTHWAADYIRYATERRLINGMGDGTFAPEGFVTQVQAVTALMKVLGYEALCELKGGYPVGYITMANQAGLLSNSSVSGEAPLTRELLTKLVYNALLMKTVTVLPVSNGVSFEINEDKTLMYELYSLVTISGRVTATEITSLSAQNGAGKGNMCIDDTKYETIYDAARLLGLETVVFCEEKRDGSLKVIYAATDTSNETLIIDGENAKFANNRYTYWDGNREKTAKLSLTKSVIYNGRYTYPLDDSEYVPEIGRAELLDFDGDGLYDLVFITSYSYYTVRSVGKTEQKIYDKYGLPVLDMDKTDQERSVTCKAYGMEVDLSYFKADDILQVVASKDFANISVELVTDSVEGKIEGIGDDTVTLASGEYKCASDLLSPITSSTGTLLRQGLSLGMEVRLYLNNDGLAVSFVEQESPALNYGYLIAYTKDSSLTAVPQFKIIYGDEPEILQSAAEVQYVDANGVGKGLKAEKLYDELVADGVSGSVIRFELNEQGQLTKLELPIDKTGIAPYDGYTPGSFTKDFYKTSAHIYNYKVGTKYSPTSDTIVMRIPLNPDLAGAEEYFKISSRSVLSQDVTIPNLTIYDSDEDSVPAVMTYTINNTAGGGGQVSTAYTNVMRNAIMLVTSVSTALTMSDEVGFAIKGWQSGGQVTKYAAEDARSFSTSLWGYPDVYLRDLKPGDIIQYQTNVKGEIVYILPLLLSENITPEACDAIVTGDVNPQQLTAYDALDLLHTMYGEVQRLGSRSITVRPGNHSDDWTWDRTYLLSNTPVVMLYDTQKKRASLISVGDIQVGDKVFLRDYYRDVREIVVYR